MKSKFNLLYEQIMSSLIKESGNMVSDVVKIKRENITLTLNKIYEEIFKPLGITKDLYTSEIGSAAEGGKKEESGDLDIAVNFKAIDELLKCDSRKRIYEFIESKGYEVRQQGPLISLRFPIQGSQLQKNEYVQVDLFNSNNLRFTEFKMRSPIQKFGKDRNKPLKEGESKYKASYRRELLSIIIKAVTLAIADDAIDKNIYTAPDGRIYPASRFKYLSMVNDGIFEITKTFIGKHGYKQTPTKDESKTKFITADPQEMLDILFGKGKYKVSDTYSFESIWNNILFDPDFPYPDKREEIISSLYHLYINTNTELPDELQEYVNTHNLV